MAGPGGCQLSGEQAGMDEALAAIYDESTGEGSETGRRGQRSAGLGPSAPNLAKWLGDIRTYFKEDVVAVIQNDAIEKKGLTQLLFEPEMLKNVEPNPQLVGTLMALKRPYPRTHQGNRANRRPRRRRKNQTPAGAKIRQGVMGALNATSIPPSHAPSIDFLLQQAFDFFDDGADDDSRGFLGAFGDTAFESH